MSNQLKRSLDYLLQNGNTFLVIEAKNEDLERGFVQLAIELIALDQWIDSDQTILQGAISTGNIWQFGQFDRKSRHVTLNLTRPTSSRPTTPSLVAQYLRRIHEKLGVQTRLSAVMYALDHLGIVN